MLVRVKFHGTRGSVLQPNNTVRYGGHTSCYEVVTDEFQIILDTGTGFQDVTIDPDRITIILYSHFHHDHIQGLPFNFGIFSQSDDIHIASSLAQKSALRTLIQTYFSGGYFPIDVVVMLKHLKFANFSSIKKLMASSSVLETFELNHPGGSMGYSIQGDGRKMAYLLDNEYKPDQLEGLLKFVDGANCVLWDGMFTESELEYRAGWGHSSMEEACKFAERANIDRLVITHHSPGRTDDELDALGQSLTSSKVSFAIQARELEF